MPSFILHFSAEPNSSQLEKPLQKALMDAGFFDTILGNNRLEYRLPPFVYQTECSQTKDQILDRAKRVAFRTGKQCAIMVTQCADTAWVGLELIGREDPERAALRAAASLRGGEEA